MVNEISVIIPTLNEEHYLPRLLDSLSIQNYPKKLQVIVVDGKSEDSTINIAKRYRKKFKEFLVIQSQRGIAKQRNLGAKKAKYKYLTFIDADMKLTPHFFAKLCAKINGKEDFIVTMLPWNASKNWLDTVLVSIARPLMYVISRLDPIVTGEFFITTKKIHQSIHGFNEDIIFGEDTDYGKRAIRCGAKYTMFFTPTIYHSVRRVKKLGLLRFIRIWIKGYIIQKTKGPITIRQRFNYEYGNYDSYLD